MSARAAEQQCFVVAVFDDVAVLHDQDGMGVADRGEPVRSAAMACWTSSSVRVSTEDVASSRISSDGLAMNALAIVSNWRSPAETVPPSALITVS